MEAFISGLASLFSISREAVIGVRKGVVVFMNPAAIVRAGGDGTGKPAISILPEHILGATGDIFVSSGMVFGQWAAISASTMSGVRVYMLCFKTNDPPEICASVAAPVRILLSNIKLASERLAALTEECGDEKILRCNAILEHSYRQLQRLLLNISIVGAVEKGDLPWLPVATEMRELCSGVTEATAFFAKKRGISVLFECAFESCYAVVDTELIEQMLLNLLSNSLLHLKEGGQVKVSLAQSGDRLIISVDDNGSGIPSDILSTIFCRWKENQTLTDISSGAGIGLGVARRIAEKHGGALILESKKGQGTSVRIMLPTDNEPSAIFRSSRTPYCLDNMDPLLIQLSTWLPTAEYVQRLDD